ncbi:hypothetical protein F383_06950 [Gossypium arboreum]|uniref:Uncharacterized protein n=1 Tax=Gossypium arboreum TaxID=29729 RepID=A0A0B0NXS4_GOSAR|nr:hypothetical protein F383_06950 [Gossypium arboreum]
MHNHIHKPLITSQYLWLNHNITYSTLKPYTCHRLETLGFTYADSINSTV